MKSVFSVKNLSFFILIEHWLNLLGSLCMAISEVFAKLATCRYDPIDFSLRRNVLLTILFGICVLVKHETLVPDSQSLIWIALAGISGPVVCRTCYLAALRHLRLSTTAIISQSQPIFAAILALVLFGQIPGILQWIGGGLIIAGCLVLLANTKTTKSVACSID